MSSQSNLNDKFLSQQEGEWYLGKDTKVVVHILAHTHTHAHTYEINQLGFLKKKVSWN